MWIRGPVPDSCSQTLRPRFVISSFVHFYRFIFTKCDTFILSVNLYASRLWEVLLGCIPSTLHKQEDFIATVSIFSERVSFAFLFFGKFFKNHWCPIGLKIFSDQPKVLKWWFSDSRDHCELGDNHNFTFGPLFRSQSDRVRRCTHPVRRVENIFSRLLMDNFCSNGLRWLFRTDSHPVGPYPHIIASEQNCGSKGKFFDSCGRPISRIKISRQD